MLDRLCVYAYLYARVFGTGLMCVRVFRRTASYACVRVFRIALRGLPVCVRVSRVRACGRVGCIYAKMDLMALRILFSAFIVDGDSA